MAHAVHLKVFLIQRTTGFQSGGGGALKINAHNLSKLVNLGNFSTNNFRIN